ncbi:fumarylacetoacetate hydrolase family protein [Amycolatopsis jejuensis]|uniref:fumarylacetoacetate hydrolase family protein n=1 Tax=Amycolatopsis jejuensis TaxID=330084 RepID=UPI000526C044|nr:fumarylacetoacetate hydrolase family protein [Amycolatopsis jejuensis]
MKYVRYAPAGGGASRVGVLVDGEVADAGFDGDMVEFIEAGAPAGQWHSVGAVRLLAPLRPRSMRDFLQFKGHLDNAFARLGREIPAEFYTVPAYYKGMPDTVIGPGDVIPWPAYTERLDHELELACVIGSAGRDIAAADASSHIFGWTIWNDVSARDVQTRELPLALGPGKAKDWDGSNVLGPCIVTADEVDGTDLAMAVRVNGEEWGRDRSSTMQHGFPELIDYVSRGQTLYPGELLGSGTAAAGSGLEIDRWVRPGDVVEMEIEGIGVLANEIGKKGQPTWHSS